MSNLPVQRLQKAAFQVVLAFVLFITQFSFLNAQANMTPDSLTISAFEAASFISNTESSFQLNYRFYSPLQFTNDASEEREVYSNSNTENKKYPLIVFLHGAGERGSDNIRQLIWGAKDLLQTVQKAGKEAFMLFPQCPEDMRWVDVNWADDSTHTTPAAISQPLGTVWELVQKLKAENPNVDANRVYVVGLSMGGYATWDLLLRYPKEIAAAVPICGWGNPNTASRLLEIPIWAFHGAADSVVPVSRSQNIVKAIQQHGGKLIRYTEYPYVGHNSWSPTFATTELWDWLFAQ